jgi:hypothetical protein
VREPRAIAHEAAGALEAARLKPEPLELAGRVALSLREAAQALGVSEAHLRNHLSKVPHFHLGGRVLFPLLELHEWARRRAQEERQEAEREAAAVLRSLHSKAG